VQRNKAHMLAMEKDKWVFLCRIQS
jgi:hypothetical protein